MENDLYSDFGCDSDKNIYHEVYMTHVLYSLCLLKPHDSFLWITVKYLSHYSQKISPGFWIQHIKTGPVLWYYPEESYFMRFTWDVGIESTCRGREWVNAERAGVNQPAGGRSEVRLFMSNERELHLWRARDGRSHIWLESMGGRETTQGQKQRLHAGAQLVDRGVTRNGQHGICIFRFFSFWIKAYAKCM